MHRHTHAAFVHPHLFDAAESALAPAVAELLGCQVLHHVDDGEGTRKSATSQDSYGLGGSVSLDTGL